MPVLDMPAPTRRVQMKPVAMVLRAVHSPLKIPAWAVPALVVLAAFCGFLAGRQRPNHHYVPYVGQSLVIDTTTGVACYSTRPVAATDPYAENASYPVDRDGNRIEDDIPMCGR
jgi:hypothetical protein